MHDLSFLFDLSENERRVLADRNASTTDFEDCPVDELIWGKDLPGDLVACRSMGGELSRREFLARADYLAARLQARGVGRGRVVGIVATAGIERLIAVLAVLRSGAAFLPIDPALPDERVHQYCRDSRSACVLADPGNAGRSAWAEFVLEPGVFRPESANRFDPVRHRSGTDWAYIVYTSGTTGAPKAAINSHRALANRLQWMARDIAVSAQDRILHKTPFGFDVAIWEQLLPFLTGAAAIIAPETLRLDPALLGEFMEREGVTIAHFVPTSLAEFVSSFGRKPARLRTIVASGEALSPVTARRVLSWQNVSLRNYYGPSEAAIDVTATALREPVPANVPIGVPIQNCQIHLLDRHLQPVKPGAEGELYIGGIPVGEGYLGRPRMTAERFVPDPFGGESGARLYRTGDVARWHVDGQIEFLGRRDRQLKLNGLRIEPGEIENALSDLLAGTAFVDAFEAPSGSRVLVGFVVTNRVFDEGAVHERLRATLPAYMVPAMILPIEALPIGPTGKADKSALARMCQSYWQADDNGSAIEGEPQTTLARIWSELIRRPVTTESAHFFKLGGDSILAIRLVAKMRVAGWSISVQDVFDRPILSELAGCATPLTAKSPGAFAEAVSASKPAVRAILAPGCRIGPHGGQAQLVPRLEQLIRELGVDTPAIAITSEGSKECPAEWIGCDARLHAAVRFSAGGEATAAFSPALLDDASMSAVSDWLARGETAPNAAPPMPSLPRPSWLSALEHIENLPGDGSWVEEIVLPAATSTSATSVLAQERRLDAVIALVLSRLKTRADRPLTALLPESGAAARKAGVSPEFFVGRLGIPTPLEVTPEVSPATVMEHRLTTEGSAVSIDIMVRHAPGRGLHAEAARELAAPASRHGLASLVVGADYAWLVMPGEWRSWAQGVLSTIDPDIVRSAIADASMLRDPRDFPLASLDSGAFDNLVADKRAIEDAYPLTPLQEGMLLRATYWPESDAYLNQNIIDLHGHLDVGTMQQAWQDVVDRYEVLRTGYRWHDQERPLAVVFEKSETSFEVLDWSDLTTSAAEAELDRLTTDDRGLAFELTRCGLYRIRLIRLSAKHHLMAWTHHHILLDGWCLALIWGDLARCYAARRGASPALQGRPRPFRDYIAWLRDHPPDELDRAFWRSTLDGARASLLSDKPAAIEGAVATLRRQLSDKRRQKLLTAASELGVTANTYIQAAWGLLIALRTGTSNVVHGVSVSGRPPDLQGVEAMVGLFINLIPLRTIAAPRLTVTEYLLAVQATLSASTRHGTLALPEILSHWRGRRSPDDRLFDSLIAFENYPDENLPDGDVAGVTFSDRTCDEKTEYPIGLIVLPGDPFEIHVNYDTAHFDTNASEEIAADLFALLDRLVDEPARHLANISLRSQPAEPREGAAASVRVKLHQLLESGSDDAWALVCGQKRWSYSQLRPIVATFAAALPPPEPREPVAIVAERGPHYAVALLSCWIRGLVPMAINPAIPDAQITATLGELGSPLVVASPEQRDRIAALATRVLVPGLQAVPVDPVSHSAPEERPELGAVLLTSGTSGRPKPVLIPTQGLEARISWTGEIYGRDKPVLLANAAPGFDIGLWEIAWPLSRGGTVVFADDDDVRDPSAFIALLERCGADALHVTPTYARALAERRPRLTDLRLIVTGGETVPPTLIERLRLFSPSVEIWQGYGPTEASVSVTDHRCDAGMATLERAPIGRPMGNCVIRLLDSAMRPVPRGATGVIHIGGPVLSTGYLGQPRETAAAFVPDPFGPPGSRLFCTGDLGCWRNDGRLEHLGRADRQVKIRGFRVQPEAIEHVLRNHPGVKEAVVAVEEEQTMPVLEAYVVPASVGLPAPTKEELRGWQARNLPAWAIVERIYAVETIPVTRNGKADYRRLREIRRPQRQAHDVPDSGAHFPTPLERAIAKSWQETLGAAPRSRHANFFESGGHSMTAMRMIASLERRLGGSVAVRVPLLFKFPTVAGLAEAMLAPIEGAGAVNLRRLQKNAGTTSGPPLVLIHPVEGITTAYGSLAGRLPHRAVYAIDDPRLELENGFASLEDMAALYLEWVRAEFGDRPVILGGWSFGGAVALEMARIMIRHSAPPAALFLLDSFDLAGRPDGFVSSDATLAGLDRAASEAPGTPDSGIQLLRREIMRNTALAIGVQPSEYPHPVTLFAASDQDPVTQRQLGAGNGWTRRIPQLAIRTVQGDHRSIMSADAIGRLAETLDQCWP